MRQLGSIAKDGGQQQQQQPANGRLIFVCNIIIEESAKNIAFPIRAGGLVKTTDFIKTFFKRHFVSTGTHEKNKK